MTKQTHPTKADAGQNSAIQALCDQHYAALTKIGEPFKWGTVAIDSALAERDALKAENDKLRDALNEVAAMAEARGTAIRMPSGRFLGGFCRDAITRAARAALATGDAK